MGIVGLLAVLGVFLAPHARYETTHDLPNPYWGIFD